MATPEALIKYYDCLKNSFNKIQDKDNKTALINAALRPKIREEFAKNREVLSSYLNYIQVFSLVYSDKFVTICSSIITPLFKEYDIRSIGLKTELKDEKDVDDRAIKIHETIQAIISSKPELRDDFVHSVIRIFPSVLDIDGDENKAFVLFLKNSLKICTYLDDETSIVLAIKILDRLNPPPSDIQDKAKEEIVQKTLDRSFEVLYEWMPSLDEASLKKISTGLLAAFTREFLTSSISDSTNYLLLYICSLDVKFADFFINSLWTTFTNLSKPIEERRTSVIYASSLISRANYVSLDMAINYLETASHWCAEFLSEYSIKHDKTGGSRENNDSFYALTQSMFYLISQRYREMYEEETIARLTKLNLNQIIESPLKPLDACDKEIEQRFQEVASLYNITNLKSIDRVLPVSKRRKSDLSSRNHPWKVPFRESCKSIPGRIQSLYRNYYDHRNFTVYRE